MLARNIRPGDRHIDESGAVVYEVESVRIDEGTRVTFTADALADQPEGDLETKGGVSALVRFAADGGTGIRRFGLDQDVPVFRLVDGQYV